MDIPHEIFRAYDIRGVVDKSLTQEGVYAIGQAVGTMVLDSGGDTVVVGRDGRLSGMSFIDSLANGIASTGCHVINIGQVPTPVLYFATHHLEKHSGIIITGSHNPPDYNGLKIVVAGKALYGDDIQLIRTMIEQNQCHKGQGQIQEQSVTQAYIDAVKEKVTVEKRLKVVVDCGNGVAGAVAPELYQSLNIEVIPLFCDVDGHFPNHHPDPGQPKNLVDLQAAVETHEADLGLAFDGDGDRLGVIDSKGQIIWPDRLMMLFAEDILSREPGATFIYDVKSTSHIEGVVNKAGGKPLMWKTGHSLIKAKMRETNAALAAEMSGHFFFKERWYGFDDALYAGARLLELVTKQPLSSYELFKTLPDSVNTPEINLSVSEEEKFTLIDTLIKQGDFESNQITTIDGMRVDFNDGWGLVRASNTTPCLVLRFEADNQAALDRIQSNFKAALSKAAPYLSLPF